MARIPKPSRPSPEIIQSPAYVWKSMWGWPGQEVVQAKSYEVFRRIWSGTRTPNFIRYRDKGELPENATSSEILWDQNSDAVDERASYPLQQYAFLYGKTLDAFAWKSSLQAYHHPEARARAIRKLISEITQSAGLAIDLGEINQTVSMIATNVTRIAHAARAIRHGNFTGAFSALGIVPNNRLRKLQDIPPPRFEPDRFKLLANYWLEFIYGWKPLVQDIYGAIEALEKFLERNQWVVAASGYGPYVDTQRIKYISAPFSKEIGIETHYSKTKCKLKVYYKRDDHVKILLAELGLTNPLDLAWELLPFSFVVDWFLPIGPWLEALHAYDGLVFVKGTEVNLTREEASLSIGAEYDEGLWHVRQIGDRQSQYIRFKREPLSGFPGPYYPTIKSPVSVIHATNALALLVAVFK